MSGSPSLAPFHWRFTLFIIFALLLGVTRESSRGIWLAIMMGGFAVLWVFWGTLSLPDLIEILVIAGALVISVVVGLVASR
jgi:hypothetical protein